MGGITIQAEPTGGAGVEVGANKLMPPRAEAMIEEAHGLLGD